MRQTIKLLAFAIGMLAIVSCTKDEGVNSVETLEFSITPIDKDFGIVEDNTSSEQEFTISNMGDEELRISSFKIEGDNKAAFSINAVSNTSVTAGESYKFKITFKPTSTGDKTGTLKIKHNKGSYSIELGGIAFSRSELGREESVWIFLEDKPSADTFIANPSRMLSAKALDRRINQGISLDKKDVPVEQSYYNQVKSSFGLTVLAKSKWLNALHVHAPQIIITALKDRNPFISEVVYADRSLNTKSGHVSVQNKMQFKNKFGSVTNDFNYGSSLAQIEMLKADVLHKKGFTGKGVVIAVMDGGFPNVNTLEVFKHLRDDNRILGGYDFVERSTNFYTGISHGTQVLSTMGGLINRGDLNFVGTAPDASFYLFITEDGENEVPLEESLWVEAAEKADSLGVDIINTSLGYSTFDNPRYNYTYADLDGQTAFITRGAEIATSRGIIVVNSAGNEGNKAWKYITMPGDAKSVLTVGAVASSKNVVAFSSVGPTPDGRTKPDVMALGYLASVIYRDIATPSMANGTSFSSPIMAGTIACLRQAYPNKNASEIVEQIKKGGDRYTTPDNNYGYGIPNFELIYENLKE